MAEQLAGEISLGRDFHKIVFKAEDFPLDVKEDDGNQNIEIVSTTPLSVDFVGGTDTKTAIIFARRAFEIGDKATKGKNIGWIYAGLSEDVKSPGYNKPLWFKLEITGVMTLGKAIDVVNELHYKEGKDRLATAGELTQIFGVVAKYEIDGFGREDYWAAKYNDPFTSVVPCQLFSHDKSDVNGQGLLKTMLLVR